MPEEQREQSPQYLQQASPGTRLRQAREAAGLSRGEVALRMHINERKVAALEEDDYEIFPSETFVSGFLRSYAKVLGLPDDDFVRPVSSSQLPSSLLPSISTGKQASSMDLPVRMVSYGIIVLVVASIAMWLISQREDPVARPVEQSPLVQEETSQPPEQMVTAEQESPALEAEVESVQDTEAEATVEAANTDDTQVTATVVDTVVMNESDAEMQPTEEPQHEQVAQVQQDSASPPKIVLDKSQSGPAMEDMNTPAVPPLTDAMPRSILVLEYEADSWTELSDNAGRQLVYGLMRAGQTIELKGEAPFKIFLGFAEGVKVHFNNDLFDHSVFRRGKVARFRVGRAEDNKPGSR